MIALKACPQPPDMSWTSTWVAESFDLRVAERESSDICVEVCFWVSSAMVSVGAAIGVERGVGVVWKGRVAEKVGGWKVLAIRGVRALRRGWRKRRRVMKEIYSGLNSC